MHKLIGFIKITNSPCFVVPLFDIDGVPNFQCNTHGKVCDFTPVDTDELTQAVRIQSDLSNHIGNDTLYTFLLDDNELLSGNKQILQSQLIARLDIPQLNPVLRLEVLTFLDSEPDVIANANNDISNYLEKLGLKVS